MIERERGERERVCGGCALLVKRGEGGSMCVCVVLPMASRVYCALSLSLSLSNRVERTKREMLLLLLWRERGARRVSVITLEKKVCGLR